ncbi:hypothetical protein D3C71_1757130 [compost metagenome]
MHGRREIGVGLGGHQTGLDQLPAQRMQPALVHAAQLHIAQPREFDLGMCMAQRQLRQHAPLRGRDRRAVRAHAQYPAVLGAHRLPGGRAPALYLNGIAHGPTRLRPAGKTCSGPRRARQPPALAGR